MSLLNLNMGVAQLVTLPLAALGQWIGLEVLFPALAVSLLLVTALILATRRVLWSVRA